MTLKPKISIITVNYNKGEFLEETILSVLNQKYRDFEYLIIDGNSTDNSVDIIKKYNKYINYWISESDNGMTEALIKGFEKANGQIYCWLNSDDTFLENTLEIVASNYQKHKFDLLQGAMFFTNIGNKIISKQPAYHATEKSHNYGATVFNQPSTFWTKELYEKTGGLNIEFKVSMDGDLFSRFLSEENIRYITIKDVLSQFRIHPGQSNSWAPEGRLAFELELIRKRSSYSYFEQFIYKTKLFKGYLRIKNILE